MSTTLQPADSRPPLLDRPSRPRESERTTRRPAVFWDRVKILLLLVGAWLVMLATVWGDLRFLEPPFGDVVMIALQNFGWILGLAVLELVRQIHYFLEERSERYYRFWEERVFGRFHRRVGRMNDWTRYRVGRALKLIFLLFLLSNILALVFNTSPYLALIEVPGRLVGALPFLLQLVFAFFFVIFQFVGLFWFLSRGGVDYHMPDEIETRFSDVKGQDAVLEQVKENIIFLEDPDTIEAKGGHVPSGILLWGPPGTGKTLMAEAVAGETARPFVAVEAGAFINMFMGVGILKVKGLYRRLRRLAVRYGGVIVFFDEADSLGSRGGAVAQGAQRLDDVGSPWTTDRACNGFAYLSEPSRSMLLRTSLGGALDGAAETRPRRDRVFVGGLAGGGGMGTLQTLLSEMQGLKKPRGITNRIRRLLGMKPKPPPKYRILHIFATNMPQALDEAMLRPGRIDRNYKVGYPQKEGRVATFWYYLNKVSHQLSDEEVDKLATITPYATGATIKDMVNEGLIIAIREGREAITWSDIIRAKQLKEHGLPDDHEYIERERHEVAVHEACHAVVAYRLQKNAVIDMATIERRGDVGGFVSYIPMEDRFVDWRSEREIDVMGSIASLAGERLFFDGDNSAGVAGDMRSATAIAVLMEGYTAMGDTMSSHAVTKLQLGRRPAGIQAVEDGSDRNLMETDLGRRVEARLRVLYDRTYELLERNRSEVLAVAHALESHKTMTGDDVAAIIDGREGPMVDGRPYHDPAFVAALEAFHAEALAAHRAHEPLRVPLPQPPGAVEAAEAPAADAGNGGRLRAPEPAPRPVHDTPPRPDRA